MDHIFSVEELHEVEQTIQAIEAWLSISTEGTVYQDEWYAGITGQEPEEEDWRAARITGHKAKFKNMDEDSWSEWELSSMEVAIEVEKRLHAMDYDGEAKNGSPGNLALEPNIVYVFKHGVKSN
jgi:hypothetical protein